jgi:hypothetical protein
VSASLEWNISQLSPLIDLFSQIATEPPDIRDIAERAGCKAKGKIPARDTADGQWQNVIRNAINEGYLDRLMQEISSKATGKLRETFMARLQQVGSRRLVDLVGVDYAKLKDALTSLIEAEEPERQLEAAASMRRIAISLWKELDDNVSWQALTPIETSIEEIKKRREALVLMCVNIISASEYMIAVSRPLRSSGASSNPDNVMVYFSGRENARNDFADSDEKLRRTIDARNALFIEARQLWSAIKENVTFYPNS